MSKFKPADRYPAKIEKGVPIPKYKYSGKFPVDEMEIGDSFLVTEEEVDGYKTIRSMLCNAATQLGFKVTCRKVDEGLRVWRIK